MNKIKFDNLEVYNKVRQHLLNQNKKAMIGNGACRYRTDEGLKCSVGCLIPDELYDDKAEGWPFDNHRVRACLPYNELTSENLLFLGDLQTIHDAHSPSEWEEELNELKEDWKL